jgi:hypothetical protein
VNKWYDEIKDYTWPQTFGASRSNGGVVGHFTQVVWKETTKVGCGKHTRCTNKFDPGYINSAVVCRCAPPPPPHPTDPQLSHRTALGKTRGG